MLFFPKNVTIICPSPGYGILSAAPACGCWKATRSLCAAFASTTKELSAAPTTGQCPALTPGSLCRLPLGFWTALKWIACPNSKIKVWDLQAALDPRAPASTLCLRTLVVSIRDFYCFCVVFFPILSNSCNSSSYFTCYVSFIRLLYSLFFFFWIVTCDAVTCFHNVS